MQWLSSRYPRIGKGLMVISVPKHSMDRIEQSGRSGFIGLGPPNDDFATFMYISATGRKGYFGPILVNGKLISRGFEIHPI